MITGVEAFGFACEAWIQSPITGAEGNIEFLACFHRSQVKDTTTMNLSVESEKLLCIEELGVDKEEERLNCVHCEHHGMNFYLEPGAKCNLWTLAVASMTESPFPTLNPDDMGTACI